MNKLIAHRGNNHDICENNLECLKQVLNYDYISGVEVDIRKTKDSKLVLSHNSFVRKDLNLYFISKTSLKELQKNHYKLKGKIFKIHTLKQFLSNIHTDKIILLDIKDNIDIEILYKTIKKFEYLNLYICSFHYDLVIRLKKAYPHLKVGLIIGYTMNENKDITPFDFLSVHYYSANKYEKDIFIWTVNCPIVFKRIPNSLGVITDSSYILKEEHIN